MKLRIPLLFALGLRFAVAASAAAVIIDSGDGTGNVTAPPSDPGWGNVGITNANGLSAVYLGDGWVLTANHVNPGDVWFGGVLYPWVPGASVRLSNPDDSLADLLLFKIADPFPPLSALSIRTTSPPLGTSLVLIGDGRNRGAATTWNGIGGYDWGSGLTKRWGTNTVQIASSFSPPPPNGFGTPIFGSTFDDNGPGHTTHEAQAASGDSGGAAFAGSQLAGIMIGILTYPGQPPETALYGNETAAADLSVYRDEINYWMPEPAGGLWAGAALVAVLARSRRRRLNAPSSPESRRTSDRAR